MFANKRKSEECFSRFCLLQRSACLSQKRKLTKGSRRKMYSGAFCCVTNIPSCNPFGTLIRVGEAFSVSDLDASVTLYVTLYGLSLDSCMEKEGK